MAFQWLSPGVNTNSQPTPSQQSESDFAEPWNKNFYCEQLNLYRRVPFGICGESWMAIYCKLTPILIGHTCVEKRSVSLRNDCNVLWKSSEYLQAGLETGEHCDTIRQQQLQNKPGANPPFMIRAICTYLRQSRHWRQLCGRWWCLSSFRSQSRHSKLLVFCSLRAILSTKHCCTGT